MDNFDSISHMNWYSFFFLRVFVSCLFYSFPSLVFLFPWFTILGVSMLMCVPYFYVDLIYFCMPIIFTPHAQRERGKVIGCGVHMFVNEKKFESYFRDRLTFSKKIRGRTSRRIYRLDLQLCAPETLSSLSKSRISIFNAHLTLFVRRMTSHISIGKYHHLVN